MIISLEHKQQEIFITLINSDETKSFIIELVIEDSYYNLILWIIISFLVIFYIYMRYTKMKYQK